MDQSELFKLDNEQINQAMDPLSESSEDNSKENELARTTNLEGGPNSRGVQNDEVEDGVPNNEAGQEVATPPENRDALFEHLFGAGFDLFRIQRKEYLPRGLCSGKSKSETDDEATEDGELDFEGLSELLGEDSDRENISEDGFESNNEEENVNFEEQVSEEVVSRGENDNRLELETGTGDEETDSALGELIGDDEGQPSSEDSLNPVDQYVVERILNANGNCGAESQLVNGAGMSIQARQSSQPTSTVTDSQYLLLLKKPTTKETLENLEKLKRDDFSCMDFIDTTIKVCGETENQKQLLVGLRSIVELLESRREIAVQLPTLAEKLDLTDAELRKSKDELVKCQAEFQRLAALLDAFRPKDEEDVTLAEFVTKLSEKRTWQNKVDELEDSLRKSTEEWNKHLDNLEGLRVKLNDEMTTHKIKEIWKNTAEEWKNKSDAIKKQEQLFDELIKNYDKAEFDFEHRQEKKFPDQISSYNGNPTDLLQDNRKRGGSPMDSICKMARQEDAKEVKKVNQPSTSSQAP